MHYMQVEKGSTGIEIPLTIVDDTDGKPETAVVFNTSGIDLWYRRQGGAVVPITEVTQTVNGAWASGGFVHKANGHYRLDGPDAAFATGARFVEFGGTVTGMVVIGCIVDLLDPIGFNGDALKVFLRDGDHGGSSLKITGKQIALTSTDANEPALKLAGQGTAAGIQTTGGATGPGMAATGGSTSGAGFKATGTAGNSPGVDASGAGSGEGIKATGGPTGEGIEGVGGSTSGSGIKGTGSNGNANGIEGQGQGSGDGVRGTGGATGGGLAGVGGATSGAGVRAVGSNGNSPGVSAAGQGTGAGVLSTGGATGPGGDFVGGATSGPGMRSRGQAGNSIGFDAVGQGTGEGVKATGGATAEGIEAVGGSSGGAGFKGTGSAGNAPGIEGQGQGTAAGVQGTGGATGPGVRGTGGATSGAGVVFAAAAGNSDGMTLTKQGTGVALNPISNDIAGIGAGADAMLMVSTTIATLTDQLNFTITAGSGDDDAYTDQMMIISDQSTAAQKANVPINDYVGSTKSIVLGASPVFNIAVGDLVKVYAVPRQLSGIKAKTDQLVFVGGMVSAVIPSNIKKNQALPNFKFVMRSITTRLPLPGASPVMSVELDNGSFVTIAGTVTEDPAQNGWYRCNFTAAEMNGNVIALHAVAASCEPFDLTILTQP